MVLWDIFAALGPYVRAATAVAPIVVALLLRVCVGPGRFTAWLIWAATMWFMLNVLLAPYSPGMRDDLLAIKEMLP